MNHITIVSPGKTTFKQGEVISREAFDKENERVSRLGEKPATGMYFNEEGEAIEVPFSTNGEPPIELSKSKPTRHVIWEIKAYKTQLGQDVGWAGQVFKDGGLVYDSSKDGDGLLMVSEAQAKRIANWKKWELSGTREP